MSGGGGASESARPIQISRPLPLHDADNHVSSLSPARPSGKGVVGVISDPDVPNHPSQLNPPLHDPFLVRQEDQQQNPTSSPPTPAPVRAHFSNRVRAPDPTKRVTRNNDELHSAISRQALDESRRANARNPSLQSPTHSVTSSPGSTVRSPSSISPASIMSSPAMHARANTIANGNMAQRTASIDSNISSISTTSSALRPAPNSALRAPQDAASQPSAASLIASSGSAEAALEKVLAEKQQLTSHNAQLWRLVEKQRSMLLGLGKDLEKMTKEKERYKRKLKEQLAHGTSMSSIMTGQTDEILDRDESASPALIDGQRASPSDISKGVRKSSDTSEVGLSGIGRSDTPQDATTLHSLGRPGIPRSSSDSPLSTPQELERSLASAPVLPPAPLNISAANNVYAPSKKVDPSNRAAHDLPSPNAQSPMPNSPQSMLSSPKTRKAPPAPLKLARQPTNEAAQEIVDASDSDYELDADGARIEYQERGRRKTREEDDRVREKSHQAEEDELRSRSKKENKQSKSRPAVEQPPIPPAHLDMQTAENANNTRQKAPAFQSMVNPADIVRNRAVSDMQRNMVAPSIMSPGLPMSPRPGDRPLLSPMPRAPMGLGGMPMSPKPGMSAFPLSPRAPRQAIPMPPQTPSAMSYPHLDRAAAYNQQIQAPSQQGAAQTADQNRPAGSEVPRVMHDQTPGEIYMGFVSDAYPDLLLPPNALPSIYIKTTSPRMKPSRQSFIAPRPGEENPVFTVAVYERSANKQLWRIEKTYQSLVSLDQQVKAVSTIQARLPDRALFVGHAPAKIDARRQVIDQYFGHLLDSVYEERAAKIVCSFLSTDAFGAEPSEYFGAPPEPQQTDAPVRKLRQNRSGYLTKRGKNFGGWKARFFVLDGPNLKYFEGPGGAQLGSIKLQNAQIGKQSTTAASTTEDEENQYRHAFLILEPKKKDSNSLVRHVLCAESDQERDEWVESLLQYVDFKDDEAHPGLQAQVWKSEITGPRSPRLQKSLNDLRSNGSSRPSDLRAVQYNELTAGEAPMMGPPASPRLPEPSSPGFDRLEHANGRFEPANSAHPTISRPSNLQVIQNASEWGNKQPPPTPNSRDKKRNVFTLPFSSKGRSSSDLPANERPSTAGVQRAVFGVELAQAVEYARPADVATDLPAVVYRSIEYLTAQNAVAEEGIFRLSGSNTVIKSLKERFNTEGDIDLLAEDNYYDIHAVASLLKLYLRELPSSILTRELHLEFLKSLELSHEDKVIAVNILVNKLPPANRALVEALSGFMLLIVDNVAVNRMNVRNLGVVFAPTLNLPGPLISLFVEEKSRIFGQPYDEASSPIANQSSPTSSHATPTDLRSPRKQMFSDLPTPAYNQTSFQPMHFGSGAPSSRGGPPYTSAQPSYDNNNNNANNNNHGMTPMHHPQTYTPYQMAPHGEGGFGSLNDALRAPNAYNPGPSQNSGEYASSEYSNSSSAGGSTSNQHLMTPRDIKAKRRESGMLAAGQMMSPGKKPSLSRLREEESGTSF